MDEYESLGALEGLAKGLPLALGPASSVWVGNGTGRRIKAASARSRHVLSWSRHGRSHRG